MAVPIYIVSGPQAGAAPIVLSGRPDATEVIIVGSAAGGGQPVYIAGMNEPGVVAVRSIGSSLVVGGTLDLTPQEATFANGEVGNVAADTVVVNWTAGIISPLADYTLGVTIKVNTIAATINSASRPSTTQTRYVLSVAVVDGDIVTWEYNSGPGDLQTIATGNDVVTISEQSITNSLTSGNSLDFSQAANSMYVPWAF